MRLPCDLQSAAAALLLFTSPALARRISVPAEEDDLESRETPVRQIAIIGEFTVGFIHRRLHISFILQILLLHIVNTHKKLTHRIGAGAAGSSAAYHLRKYAEQFNVGVNITIFEKTDHIGGRTLTINPFDDPSLRLELGASIFIEKNYILNGSVEEFGLQTKDPDVGSDPNMGFWDGDRFVFEIDTSRHWALNAAHIAWKYGPLAPMRTDALVEKTVSKFLQMYEEPYFPFKSLTQRAYDLDLTSATGATGEEFLKANGVSCRASLGPSVWLL